MQMLNEIEVPGTIDHHTVVYEYLDGRKLMSLKQGSPECFFGEATTFKVSKRKFLIFSQKKHVAFPMCFSCFW